MARAWDGASVTAKACALTFCDASWAHSGALLPADSFNRLYWLESGEARLEHDGGVFELLRGRFHVIPANSPGRYLCVKPMKLHWLHFNARLANGLELYDCAGFSFEAFPSPESWREIDRLWRRAELLWSDDSPQARFESDGIFLRLLSFMAATRDASRPPAELRFKRFEKALARMDEALERNLKVRELAALTGLQENYFEGLFKASFGVSPMAFLMRKRIRRAQELLKSSGMTLKEIAGRCGFGSEHHLSAAFKKAVGASPGAWRRSSAHEIP